MYARQFGCSPFDPQVKEDLTHPSRRALLLPVLQQTEEQKTRKLIVEIVNKLYTKKG